MTDYHAQFTCGFQQAKDLFPDALNAIQAVCEDAACIEAFIDRANFLCKIGLGAEPVLTFMDVMPEVVKRYGPETIERVARFSYEMGRSPNKQAVVPFLQSLLTLSHRVESPDGLERYLEMLADFIKRTEIVVHGHQSLYPSKGLVPLLENMPLLLKQLSLEGVRAFMDYGVRAYNHNPDHQQEYFELKTPDGMAMLRRQREGTLFVDVERQLGILAAGLWGCELPLRTFTVDPELPSYQAPFFDRDNEVIGMPDFVAPARGLSGLQIYRAQIAHLMAHFRWSQPLIGDNMSPPARYFTEVFEDCRVDRLAMAHFPGLKPYFLALHPVPPLGACNEAEQSCLRYRAARLSRALMDPDFDPEDEIIEAFRDRFNALMAEKGEALTLADMKELGTAYYVKTRAQTDDQGGNMFFEDTEVLYRDDNRCLWIYIDDSDEEDIFDHAPDNEDETPQGLPPRYYDEWDYSMNDYRPEWVTLYERLHPQESPARIDNMLARHEMLIKQLKKMVEAIKPQDKRRIRYQEEGAELDLDIAIRAMIDIKAGLNPDPRILYDTVTDNRSMAVLLLVDLSQSLNNTLPGTGRTLLELAEEALAIMSYTVELLGDRFAIAGFHSDTRHRMLYHHIKGFGEHWDDEVKGRLSALEAAFSTRMGAAIRHATHYLSHQPAEKKLLLVLTDGEPADIDVKDPEYLIEDAHMAVAEAHQQGIFSHCVNIDPNGDDYVKRIFGGHYTIIDHVERLPERLPQVFFTLTK